ncbi:YjdF family protein [Abyssisolibacter fermentans]|uniref:YjdF family protein n=1 Tax=Abyssisolibacter fermentans TaxID=1766203 RepID=UPI00082D09FA|nr:YjdF family protein [Abyssisolibacter fermentans]
MNKLTVYFEEPFWVGVFERIENGKLEIAKTVFGSEPKDYEVYEFILSSYYNLRFSKPMSVDMKTTKKINPKRLQRKVRKETQTKGIGTKAQQAINKAREENKLERKISSKEKREREKEIKYQIKHEKKKKKKRGH